MATNYLAEAFQQMKLLESETFSFDNDGAAKLSNFMDDDLLTDVEVVIDPEAETEEDLKDSYIGDIILSCEVCHSMIYKREEEISVEEDSDMANVGELCPYCYSSDGFKIIGKVAPYEEITVETESGEDVTVEVDGKKIEADDEDEVKDLDPETEEDKPEDDDSEDDEQKSDEEELDESVKSSEEGFLTEAKDEPLSVRLKRRLAMKAENLEEEVIKENYYAVVVVDGEERRFPFANRDRAREYLAYVRNGAPEFKGKKIGSMWTESLDAEDKPLKESVEEDYHFNDETGKGFFVTATDAVIDYIEKLITPKGGSRKEAEDIADAMAESFYYYGNGKNYTLKDFKYDFQDKDDFLLNIDHYLKKYPEALKLFKQYFPDKLVESKNLKEGMEDISITTETDVIKVKSTPREDKEAIVPMQPEEVEKIVEPEVAEEESAVEDIPEEEFIDEPIDTDVDIEEIDEEGFDELGESYLKKVYENVESYKTISGSLKNNCICLEGIITFNSGKKAKTNFIFEAKEMTKRGKLKFIGENVNLSKNKKAFTLTGTAENKKLMCEALTYNYLARDAKNNKAKKLYGTIRK